MEKDKNMEMILKLQGIDYELGELERSKDYLPDMINNLEKEIQEISKALEDSEKEVTEQTILHKKLDIELAILNQELAKFQKQMQDIKTNKEYDALTNEIVNRKLKISSTEEEILKILTNIDDLKEKIKEYKQRSEEVDKNNTAQLAYLKKELNSIEDKVKIKQGERKNLTVRIDKRLLSTYERVKKGRGDQVIVTIKKRACTGCYKGIPPQKIQEIRKGDLIFTCDNCGRILIWTEDSS
jgi:predicted  nucleic acid-binding Zn-ribbon protein